MRTEQIRSGTLDEQVRCLVHESGDAGPRNLLLLLHGRGDGVESWAPVLGVVDALVDAGSLPPQLVVMPTGQWSAGAHFWTDSTFTGEPPGRPVATALVDDVLPHLERTVDLAPGRDHRVVAGYSMGGAGAVQLLLGRSDLFGAGLALAPAVYDPLPPADSSARAYGAYGRGPARFDPAGYRAGSYATLLQRHDPALPVRLHLAVGDREWRHPRPADRRHDLDRVVAAVHALAGSTPGVESTLDVLPGGHDWSVWLPAMRAGLLRLGANRDQVGVS